ncbi:hypothetical protein SKAU_G00336890 [Synaphobranchus kaupii]|uniref:Uncharacterized protein n=1 Tax=Synaphobranchus kaupii TaxID=118154 RepID=A0A9Q1IGV9_SYNKA|nr:hypothetical protein SKAU_G00336890 [Synaphobranchus kaupii]
MGHKLDLQLLHPYISSPGLWFIVSGMLCEYQREGQAGFEMVLKEFPSCDVTGPRTLIACGAFARMLSLFLPCCCVTLTGTPESYPGPQGRRTAEAD